MAGIDPMCWFAQYPLNGHIGMHGVFPKHGHEIVLGHSTHPLTQ